MYFKYTEYLIGPTVTKFKGTISAAIDTSKSQLSYFLLVQYLLALVKFNLILDAQLNEEPTVLFLN